MQTVDIFASPLPFSNMNVHHVVPQGLTLDDMVSHITGDAAHLDAVVMINDYVIPRGNWAMVKPKQGTIVNIRVLPHGGGGRKNPIASLLSIALLVAAPYASTALLGTTLAGTTIGIGTLTYGTVLSAGIGLVGRLAIGAIAPPPRQSNAGGGVNNPSESPTQFIEGARNSINRFGVVPVCLGTNRMFPLQAALPFQESQDNKQYVRQLFTWGFGAQLQITELKIGETAIEEFSGVEIEHRLAGDLSDGTNLYANDVFQDDYNVLIQQVDGFTTRTTQDGADEAVIDITFPRGLASFNAQGQRGSYTVELDLQYRLTGSSGAWSAGAQSFASIAAQNITAAMPPQFNGVEGRVPFLVCIDGISGVAAIKYGTFATNFLPDSIPRASGNEIALAQGVIANTRNPSTNAITTSLESLTDSRQPSLFGNQFQASTDFAVSNTGLSLTVAAGSLKQRLLLFTESQTSALRRSLRVKFPESGQYDIRIARLTADTSSDQIFDKAFLTAIKSITYRQPVNLAGVNGTAIRIVATDQLNGALDQFNAVVSNIIPDYFLNTDEWLPAVTSNPASIYLYVLKGGANSRPIADSRIDFARIQEWHAHCAAQGYTYNRVIDYDTNLYDVLKDIAAAGAASPTILDGKFSLVIDKVKNDIVQMVTPRNSWGYSAELVYPDLPHAFRVQFRNKNKGYALDERIVYDDGYNAENATEFEQLEYLSTDNAGLAYKHGRRHIATARLRPESHSFYMDVEHIVMTRGDRIKFAHDIPIIGVGDGRVKTITDNGTHITGFSIDDVAEFISGRTYYVRVRKSDGAQLYLALASGLSGEENAFILQTPILIAEGFAVGDLAYFVEAGGELDLIVSRIEPTSDLSAKITAVDYAPSIFDAETGTIPQFTSRITTPLSLLRPSAPVLVGAPLSDESLMTRNSDGSFTSRMAISLQNLNDGQVEPVVIVRLTGTDSFAPASLSERTTERVVLTGLEDGQRYDVWVSYKRVGTTMQSAPLQINNYLFVGASGLPFSVANFRSVITDGIITLSWDANTDIDISHYELRFSRVFSGATWDTAQTLQSRVNETRITLPFIGGTYLIKAIDLLGNESADAAVIITYADAIANVVATLTENPSFAGALDNVIRTQNSIILGDETQVGYYYFDNTIDLTDVYESQVSATIIAGGSYTNNMYGMDDMFAVADLFGAGGNNVFDIDDLFAAEDIFGIEAGAWRVTLEARYTNDDPSGSPVWTDWIEFAAGFVTFRAAEYRLKMESFESGITPQVTGLSVTIDMPDRIERGEDLIVPAGGLTVTHSPAFRAEPAVAITIQDGATDDRIEFTTKSASGFTFRVFNATAATYVERSFDYIASGYGRVLL